MPAPGVVVRPHFEATLAGTAELDVLKLRRRISARKCAARGNVRVLRGPNVDDLGSRARIAIGDVDVGDENEITVGRGGPVDAIPVGVRLGVPIDGNFARAAAREGMNPRDSSRNRWGDRRGCARRSSGCRSGESGGRRSRRRGRCSRSSRRRGGSNRDRRRRFGRRRGGTSPVRRAGSQHQTNRPDCTETPRSCLHDPTFVACCTGDSGESPRCRPERSRAGAERWRPRPSDR